MIVIDYKSYISSDHFGIESSALYALDAVVVELRIGGLMQTLITQNIDLLIFELFGQGVLGLGYLLIDICDFCWLHLVPGHAARRAIKVVQHLLAFDMDEVSAWQVDVSIG